MSGHTPGPWVVDEYMSSEGIYKIRAADSNLCLIHSVAPGHRPSPEATSNAALIAAAPELLAALSNALRSLDTDGPASAAASLATHGRAAIAKATR